MHHPIDMIVHTTAFVTPVVEHWLEREIAQWVKSMHAHLKTNMISEVNVSMYSVNISYADISH